LLALLEHFLAVITAQDNGVCAANGAPQCCAGFPRSIRPSAAAETYRCGATRRLLEAGRSVWSLNRRIPLLPALLEHLLPVFAAKNHIVRSTNRRPVGRGYIDKLFAICAKADRRSATRRLLEAGRRVWGVNLHATLLLSLDKDCFCVVDPENNGVRATHWPPDCCGGLPRFRVNLVAEANRRGTTRRLNEARRAIWSVHCRVPVLLALFKDHSGVVITENDSVRAAYGPPDRCGGLAGATAPSPAAQADRRGATRRLNEARCCIRSIHRCVPLSLTLVEDLSAVIAAEDKSVCATNGAPDCCGGITCCIRPPLTAEADGGGAARRLQKTWSRVWSLDRRIPHLLALVKNLLAVVPAKNDCRHPARGHSCRHPRTNCCTGSRYSS